MKKKRLRIKDKKIQEFLKIGGRIGAKKDFLEVLKKAVNRV